MLIQMLESKTTLKRGYKKAGQICSHFNFALVNGGKGGKVRLV